MGTPQEALFDDIMLGENNAIGCDDTGADVGLNDVIFQEAGDYGLPVANTFGPMKWFGSLALRGDLIHPNNTGHSIIAQAFRDAAPRCPATPDGGPDPSDPARSLPGHRGDDRGRARPTDNRDQEPRRDCRHLRRDRIRARGGNDLVCAGTGNDEVSGATDATRSSGGR